MDELIAFLRARLDEDEAAQREKLGPLLGLEGFTRELREIEAKRAILDLRERAQYYSVVLPGRVMDEALMIIAVVYSDHPDYDRQEWAPYPGRPVT